MTGRDGAVEGAETGELRRALTGLFVGCDGRPCRATCSFHDRSGTLTAGDRIQIEVEGVSGEWLPLFHRCLEHGTDRFPARHGMAGSRQALVVAELRPTGAFLPKTSAYAPDALTLSNVEVVDVCGTEEGPRSAIQDREPDSDRDVDRDW